MTVELTVWDVETVHVVPDPLTIVVPRVTPTPDIVALACKAPVETLLTVSVSIV